MWLSKFQLMIMDNTKSYKNPKNGFKRLEKSWVYSSPGGGGGGHCHIWAI